MPTSELCRGPGNLTMAMGITLEDNRVDLVGDRLFVEDVEHDVAIAPGRVSWGPRIGIRLGAKRPWRVWIAGHPAVSGRS